MGSAEITRLHALLRQRQFSEALAQGEALLASAPDQREVLLVVATALRYLGRHADALQRLLALEQLHPRFSRLHEERGRCYIDLKAASRAIEAFEQAVGINHSLPGSWRMLEGL